MSQRRYTYLVKEDILLLKRRYTAFLRKAHRAFVHSGMGGLMLLSLWLTACVGEELQKPLLGEGEGYLRLQVAPVSAEISTSPLTKAEIATPDKNDLTINIKQGDTSVAGFPMLYAKFPDLLVLKAGVTYTVEAYYETDSTLQVKPYFHKSEDVTVKANQSNDVTLNVSLANAMLEPVVDTNLAKHYSSWKLTASTNDKSYTFAEKDQPKTTLYAKAGETVTFTFSGTNLAGKKVSSSWDKTFEAGYAYQLQCNPNIEAFKSIKVNATAKHTYDGSGNLDGTDITFTPVSNGADLAAIDSWQVDVHYNNQIIRTYTGKSLSNMSYTDTGWPYIPQGSTLSASVTLKAKDKITLTNASFTSLPAPDFEVSVSAQTSYSVYTKSGAAAANEKDGSSIFNIGSTVKISDEILTNSNYANILPKVTYTTDTGKSSGELAYNATNIKFTGLAWQKHVLTATASFEGVSASASMECDVTGLPYTADFNAARDDKNWLGWTPNGGAQWGTKASLYVKVILKGPNGFIVSPKFHCPDDLHVSIPIEAEYYYSNSLINRKTTDYYIGPTDSPANKSTSGYDTKSISSQVITDYREPRTATFSITLGESNSYISISAGHEDTFIFKVQINYR